MKCQISYEDGLGITFHPGSLMNYATRIQKRDLERCSELRSVFKEVSKNL
jgi:hypothetical protein